MTKATNSTGHLFAGKRSNKNARDRTSESIAADIAAFELAGGTIEALGNTCTLKHIPTAEAVPPGLVRSSLGRNRPRLRESG